MKIQIDLDNKGEVPFEEIRRSVFRALRGFRIVKIEEVIEKKETTEVKKK